MTDQSVVILRGLPASGKSTYARLLADDGLVDDGNRLVRVNRDDLRTQMFTKVTYAHDQEAAVTKAEHAMLHALLAAGRSVVIDNCNLRAKYVRQYLEIIGRYPDVLVSYRDFDVPVDEAVTRDKLRSKPVGEAVIRDMASRYLRKGRLPDRPSESRTQPVAGRLYIPDESLPTAYIVDIDGTVATNDGHRSFYDYTKVGDDKPVWSVIQTVLDLHSNGHQLVFLSGRKDECQLATAGWLNRYIIVPFHGPYMRASDDDRDDAIVKIELFDKFVRDRFNVLGAFDDRNRVVKMWRDIGITCYQVADGNF